jgi:hypothetical protein
MEPEGSLSCSQEPLLLPILSQINQFFQYKAKTLPNFRNFKRELLNIQHSSIIT